MKTITLTLILLIGIAASSQALEEGAYIYGETKRHVITNATSRPPTYRHTSHVYTNTTAVLSAEIAPTDDQTLLAEYAKHEDAAVRRYAVSKINDKALLFDILIRDSDEAVHSAVSARQLRLSRIEKISDAVRDNNQGKLENYMRTILREEEALMIIPNLTSKVFLEIVAVTGYSGAIRKAAEERFHTLNNRRNYCAIDTVSTTMPEPGKEPASPFASLIAESLATTNEYFLVGYDPKNCTSKTNKWYQAKKIRIDPDLPEVSEYVRIAIDYVVANRNAEVPDDIFPITEIEGENIIVTLAWYSPERLTREALEKGFLPIPKCYLGVRVNIKTKKVLSALISQSPYGDIDPEMLRRKPTPQPAATNSPPASAP